MARISRTVILLAGLAITTLAYAQSDGSPVVVPTDSLDGWKTRTFVKATDYRVTVTDGGPAIRAHTDGGATALYREIHPDIRRRPVLRWEWKISTVYPITNPREKAGDDYPARVYVVVREGLLPWQTTALNYVWVNAPMDAAWWPNPFTDKAFMVPVRTGADGVGQWHTQRVNVVADYERLTGRRLESIDGIALMTDGDNSGQAATAWYRNLRFEGAESGGYHGGSVP